MRFDPYRSSKKSPSVSKRNRLYQIDVIQKTGRFTRPPASIAQIPDAPLEFTHRRGSGNVLN